MTTVGASAAALSWHTTRKRLPPFLVGGAAWDVFFVLPLVLGVLLKAVFDGITDERGARYFTIVIGAYAAVTLVRRIIVHYGAIVWAKFWIMVELLLRGSMLRAQVSSGGAHAGPPVRHGGAAMTMFRDDPQDVARFIDSWIDIAGAAAFSLAAVLVMASIDVVLTVFVLLPVAAIAVTTRLLGHWVSGVHRRHLERTSRLTASLRDAMAAHTSIRLYDARRHVTDEVRRRARERSRAAVIDRTLSESIRAASLSLTEVAVGVMLLVIATDLRSDAFSVGDLALFTAYLGYLSFLPRMTGHFMTRHRQADVAFSRMGELAPQGRADNLLADFDLALGGGRPRPPMRRPTQRLALDVMTAHGLTHLHADGGIRGADLELRRGSLTVVTGHVGAGKTTLLRALLGLVPAAGCVYWNGELLDDRAAFLTPPHAAYLPQNPRLFSDTVAANIRLGHSDAPVDGALRLAGLHDEVSAMSLGDQTLVGPRGVRLSGGQRQRLGLARALFAEPELLVLDDLSSAIDADTELAVWEHLQDTGATILAVSNRPIAVEAADQVLTVADGRVSA